MQELADDSPQVAQFARMQELADSRPRSPATGGMAGGPGREAANKTGLPDRLKEGVEALSGLSLGDVRVHYDSPEPARLRAEAFTRGSQIFVAPHRERHLPHEAWHVVQQKRGQARGTRRVAGSVVCDDPTLEREADAMGARAQRRGATGDATAPLARISPPAGGVVQRAIGMEIEVGMAVCGSRGEKLAGDAEILRSDDVFKLVTDSRGAISNLEFVMFHFDQHAVSEEAALAELNGRLNAIRALYNIIYARRHDEGMLKLSDIAPGYTYAAETIPVKVGKRQYLPRNVSLNPAKSDDDGEEEDLFVQYTIGMPIGRLHTAITYISAHSYDPEDQVPTQHAATALNVAARAAERYEDRLGDPADAAQFTGYIALVYTQLAAFADTIQAEIVAGMDDPFPTAAALNRSGQIKNNTVLLSRVPLGTVFGALRPGVRDILQAEREEILTLIAGPEGMERQGMAFAAAATRDVQGLESISLDAYAESALGGGGDPIEQQRVFGGMKETPLDPTVPGLGVPLEVRGFRADSRTWTQVYADARTLLLWSRYLAAG
jgi:hypothetical protein